MIYLKQLFFSTVTIACANIFSLRNWEAFWLLREKVIVHLNFPQWRNNIETKRILSKFQCNALFCKDRFRTLLMCLADPSYALMVLFSTISRSVFFSKVRVPNIMAFVVMPYSKENLVRLCFNLSCLKLDQSLFCNVLARKSIGVGSEPFTNPWDWRLHRTFD